MICDKFIEEIKEILDSISLILENNEFFYERDIIRNSELDYIRVDWDVSNYAIIFKITYEHYQRIQKIKKKIESELLRTLSIINERHHLIKAVFILPTKEVNPSVDFRNSVIGKRINNQGRVRSDNLASLEYDGLYFRSEPEINLYKALKRTGIVFAPLPVFLKGGKTYERYEPDFVIIKDGLVTIIEVDGFIIHSKTKEYDSKRQSLFEKEGVKVIRVNASDCYTLEDAHEVVKRIILKEVRLKHVI